MTIFKLLNEYIDNYFGLEQPLTIEDKQIIGMELSNAMSAVDILARQYLTREAHMTAPIREHIETDLVGITFDGNITDFELSNFVNQDMSVIEFIAGVSKAFYLWPYLLTRTKRPSRRLFSDTVKGALFKNNEQGWQNYVASMRERGLAWFGQEER